MRIFARLCLPVLLGFLLLPNERVRAAAMPFTVAVPKLDTRPSLNGVVDDSWSKAAQVPVLFDFTYQRDGEPATAYLAQDLDGLDVAFVVTQRTQITLSAETNGPGVANDDNVTVQLWPQGNSGFGYSFSANARGARYQTSGENSAYSPEWIAGAKQNAGGYVVTMHIPFRIIRSGGSTSWNVQLERVTQATNSTEVWEHAQGQRNAADRAFAGTLTGIALSGGTRAARPQPRLQIYVLGELTTRAFGGSTSRVGADLSMPVTPTSSLVASLHPDYSNVEIDQQTISPSVFARQFSEVRPFFTQVGNNFNNTFSCTNCPTILYTPAIPTFRQGYAYEGTQGPLSFAAYDAVGFARTDSAQVLNFAENDPVKIESLSLQRVSVNVPGFQDVTTSLYSGYEWQKTHLFVYFNGGWDRGTGVTQPGSGNYFEYGGGYVDKDSVYGFTLQTIGPQFQPADGFVSQANVAGPLLFANHTIRFAPKAELQDVKLSSFFAQQHDRSGNPAQNGENLQVNFDLRQQVTLHVFGGNFDYETFDGQYLPFNQNGFYLGYKAQTSTPSSVSYSGGSYFHGKLGTWSYLATLPLRRNVHLSLEADETDYVPLGQYVRMEPEAKQWLERAGIDYQLTRTASFDIGVRRLIGRNLPNAFETPRFDFLSAGNLSAAFHFLAAQNEWYIVYGNPNNLSTLPAFYVKWIRYVGAQKGT